MQDLVTKREYNKLLADLRRIIHEGKEEAEPAATQALIETYWAIGRRIAREKGQRARRLPQRHPRRLCLRGPTE